MARLNLTVPDPLYERLEQVRDRVNVSKVCAVALEKELDMIQARPSVADPKIAKLIERLKGSSQRWYDRGHEDGERWATEEAKRSELEDAAYAFRAYDGRQLSSAYFYLPEYSKGEEGTESEGDEGENVAVPELPGVGSLSGREDAWVIRDLGLKEKPYLGEPAKEAYQRFQTAFNEVDHAAYLEGWRDALVELWDAVALALR